jgi:hypothetical protein
MKDSGLNQILYDLQEVASSLMNTTNKICLYCKYSGNIQGAHDHFTKDCIMKERLCEYCLSSVHNTFNCMFKRGTTKCVQVCYGCFIPTVQVGITVHKPPTRVKDCNMAHSITTAVWMLFRDPLLRTKWMNKWGLQKEPVEFQKEATFSNFIKNPIHRFPNITVCCLLYLSMCD